MTDSRTRLPLDLRTIDTSLVGAEHTWGRDHELLMMLRALLGELRIARMALQQTEAAIQWASGSQDFQAGGYARGGFEQILRPAQEYAAAVLARVVDSAGA